MSRLVTVASVSRTLSAEEVQDQSRMLEGAAAWVQRAVRMGADIVAFPEVYPQIGKPHAQIAEFAEPPDGPTIQYMAQVAREHGCWVIWPLWSRVDGQIRNSAYLLDRQGRIAGRYDKIFPTMGEMEAGIVPGTEPCVFETDFGRLGMCICFDLNFPPVLRGLKDNGAEIIFFCSAYRGGLQVQAWALELGCYLVTAIGADLGRIVDLTGRVLQLSHQEALITQQLNLERRLLHMDCNWDKMDAMLAKYGSDISFDYVAPEARYAVGSHRPGLTVEALIEEFGLLTMEEYWARVHRMREARLGSG